MPVERLSGKLVAFVASAFLVVVLVQVLWQQTEEEGTREEPQSNYAKMQVEKKGTQVNLAPGEAEEGRRSRARVQKLIDALRHGTEEERRRAAVRLEHRPHRAAAQALLDGLNNASPRVAEQCAESLISLWQLSDWESARKLLRQAINEYRGAGATDDLDEALEMLKDAEEIDAGIPDLYRIRAEIWLSKSRPNRALEACEKALELEPSHFRAYHVMARSYLQRGEKQKALASLEDALSIYSGFEEATRLKTQIQSEG